ncbi:hypothetical protein Taro_032654 [Colocasia esculenta]|uniref:Uncharacterized protein n=1 Tax=Colocasia esculenta TaxID=4460 RepID=A0A843W4J6_COLES|nr:hypothetical protein [Colocasia esculenta]
MGGRQHESTFGELATNWESATVDAAVYMGSEASQQEVKQALLGHEPRGDVPNLVSTPEEAVVVPLDPPVSSPLKTPAPPSPPSSSTAPLALATFKQPLPKHISSPTPFPATSSSPISSSTIPPPPIIEEPPALSSSAGPSSSDPFSARPSTPPPPTSIYSLHSPTPPSFITIIPEGARIQGEVIQDIKDEFEEEILRLVLSTSSHIHRTSSSSPAPKKRKVSKDLALSSEPQWFVIHHRKSWGPFIQREIKLVRHFQMFQDYRFVNKLPEVQTGQFRGAIAQLRTENPVNTSLQAQALAPVPQEHGHGGPSIMERFKRMAPPSFKGESDPLLAESWMREIEKIFRAIRCAKEGKVNLATYMLQGEIDDQSIPI